MASAPTLTDPLLWIAGVVFRQVAQVRSAGTDLIVVDVPVPLWGRGHRSERGPTSPPPGPTATRQKPDAHCECDLAEPPHTRAYQGTVSTAAGGPHFNTQSPQP